jgi:hypothetical protein
MKFCYNSDCQNCMHASTQALIRLHFRKCLTLYRTDFLVFRFPSELNLQNPRVRSSWRSLFLLSREPRPPMKAATRNYSKLFACTSDSLTMWGVGSPQIGEG